MIRLSTYMISSKQTTRILTAARAFSLCEEDEDLIEKINMREQCYKEFFLQEAPNVHQLDDMYALGQCCKLGMVGIKHGKVRAATLYQIAAKYGHLDSKCVLAACYQHGVGVDKDEKRAFELYQEGANQDHLDCI